MRGLLVGGARRLSLASPKGERTGEGEAPREGCCFLLAGR